MSVAPNNVIRVTFNQRDAGGNLIQNVFHMRNDSGLTLDNATVLDDMHDWLSNMILQLDDIQVDSFDYESCRVYNVTTDEPVGEIGFAGPPHGTLADDPMPSGVAALVTLDTGHKRALGKKFFGGLAETATTGGSFNGAFLADMAGVLAYLLGVQSVNTHDYMPGSWRDVVNTFYPFISAVARAIPAYQRRRKTGVGA